MEELKITYEKGWDCGCIHIDVPCAYEETYQMRMVRNNAIPHLSGVTGSGRDGTSRYTFRPGGGIQMAEKYGAVEIKAREILSFTEQFLETADSLKEHMIDPDGLILKPELIFAEAETCWFCYLPSEKAQKIYNKTLKESFHEMTEYFIKRMDYRETEAILLVYRLHKETMQENYDIRKILDDYKKECKEYEKEKNRECVKKEKRTVEDQSGSDMEEGTSELSDGTIFLSDGEEETEPVYRQKKELSCLKEKGPGYGPIRKVISKIKTGRWGQWEDMITEIDGQNRDGHL